MPIKLTLSIALFLIWGFVSWRWYGCGIKQACPEPPPPPEEKKEEVEQEIFVIVEDMPEIIGGIQALMNEIKYPALARQAGIEGRVIVQMVVDETGHPKDIVVLRGIGGGCDEEAIRAVSTMKFKPGKQRGRPVPVRYSVSVQFRLKDIENR